MQKRMTPKLVDALYVEAMVLADEARAYFDEHGRADRDALAPIVRVGFSCESLKVTTRLMHIVAWLLTRRAVEAGELDEAQSRSPSRRLGAAPTSQHDTLAMLPAAARALVDSSIDLYARVARINDEIDRHEPAESPARTLMGRLERSF